MKDDRFRIGLLLSPIANLAKNLPNDLREQGDSSGQAILTFRLRAITAGIQGTLQAARGRETRSEPSTNPMSSNSSQADSAGSIPVTRSKREQRCRTNKFDCLSQAGQRSFASENGTRAITRAISHLGECPWRLSVPKLTVRVRFPSPAPHAKNRLQ